MYIDLIHSSAVKNISREPHLLTLAGDILRTKNVRGEHIILECDLGRTIGYDYVVDAEEAENIFYVRLLRDSVYTRFTRKGVPFATSYLTILLELAEDGTSYDVQNIWIGRHRPPLPGSANETETSASFWKHHAVVFQNQPMQANTLTKAWPY